MQETVKLATEAWQIQCGGAIEQNLPICSVTFFNCSIRDKCSLVLIYLSNPVQPLFCAINILSNLILRSYQLAQRLLNRGVLVHLGLVVKILKIADVTTGIQ